MCSRRAIALGGFDGLHSGHMEVIKGVLKQRENGFTPAVLLLDPLPSAVLREVPPKAIMCNSYKIRMLQSMGLEILSLNFNNVIGLAPARFFHEVLLGMYNAGVLSCGFNYRFGAKGLGSSKTLAALCGVNGIYLNVAPEIKYGSRTVSSTAIRSALEAGAVEQANALLGREYGYCLTVVHGDHIGASLLNCPTINQHFPDEMLVPKYGVYSSKTLVDGVWMRSVTNIGRRPSFQSDEQRSETHIIGYNGNLYGQEIEVRLTGYKRGEIKFGSLEELKRQLKNDMI